MEKLHSIPFLLRSSFSFIKEHFFNLFLLSSASVILAGIAELILIFTEGKTFSAGISILLGLSLIGLGFFIAISGIVFTIALYNYISVSYTTKSAWVAMQNALKSFWSAVWVSLILFCILVGLFPTIILPILMLPIILVLPFYFISGTKGVDVFVQLWYVIRKNYWKVFGRVVFMFFFNFVVFGILGLITFFCFKYAGIDLKDPLVFALYNKTIIWIFRVIKILMGIVSSVYFVEMLRQLVSIRSLDTSHSGEDTQSVRGWVKGLSIWGLVVLACLFVFWICAIIFTVSKGFSKNLSSDSSILYTSNDKTYKDILGKFTMKYPDTWEIVEEGTGATANRYTYIIAPFRTIKSPSRGSIAITRFQVGGYNLEELGQQYEDEINSEKADTKNDTLISIKRLRMFDTDVIQFTRQKLRSFDKGNTYFTQVSEDNMFIMNGTGYLVGYHNNSEDFQQMKSLGNKIIGTFTATK